MAMSVTEANHLNVLLDWLLGVPRGEEAVPDARAVEAAAALADSANKRLSAGVDGATVRRLWAEKCRATLVVVRAKKAK